MTKKDKIKKDKMKEDKLRKCKMKRDNIIKSSIIRSSIIKRDKLSKEFEENVTRQFNMKTFAVHDFSESYIQRKTKIFESFENGAADENILKNSEKSEKVGRRIVVSKTAKIVATTVIIFVIGSTGTVYAMNYVKQHNSNKLKIIEVKKGDYGVDYLIEKENKDEEKEIQEETRIEADENLLEPRNNINTRSQYYRLVKSYIPDDMTEVEGSEEETYSNDREANVITGSRGNRGFMIQLFDLSDNTGQRALETFDVVSSNQYEINGHQAIYLVKNETINEVLGRNASGYTKKMYVYFEEQECMAYIFGSSTMTDDEMINIAKGLELINGTEDDHTYLEDSIRLFGTASKSSHSNVPDSVKLELPKDNLNIYEVGEKFTGTVTDADGNRRELTYQVEEIKVSDNFNGVGSGKFEAEIFCKKYMDKNGKVLPERVLYVNEGDGIFSVDTIVEDKMLNQKVVYVKAVIKNEGNEDCENVPINFNLARIVQTSDSYQIVSTASGIACDYVVHGAAYINNKMIYYDFVNSSGDNGIDCLKAGEERMVNMAFCVDEEDLPYLYLNADIYGGGSEFFYEEGHQNKDALKYVKLCK